MKIQSLEEAFIHGLSDIYSAEKQLVKALPKLARAASNPKLAEGFNKHFEETEKQVDRIDQIVQETSIKLHRIKCKAMEGLIAEGNETIEEIEQGPVRDVMLIAGAQKVEHYEIAAYGCLVEIAKQLGQHTVARLLTDTLKEEKATDDILNKLAISDVNQQALKQAA
jgi:ferritin-like metal-binding protein YciE